MADKTAVRVTTGNSTGLLARIRQKIKDGEIDTWTSDKDGDFTHIPEQWNRKAFLRPTPDGRSLSFALVWPKDSPRDAAVRGVYLGRFIEMLVVHFPDDFSAASAI